MPQFSSIKVAALQMISSTLLAENLATAERLIVQAAQAGAQLLVLPEYFAIMGARDTDKLALIEDEGRGPIQDFLAAMAQKHQVWLAGGTLGLRAQVENKVRNSLLLFNPQGQRVARYDKIHLFGFDNGSECYRESDTIERGDTPIAVDTEIGRLGLSVCYDLRFPELFRAMGALDILILPAAFTATTGRAHWEVLLRARAIENQCFVVASGQGGVHQTGRETFGHSMLIDPWGQVLDCLPSGEGFAIAELKASQLERVRKTLPALAHRVM